MGETEANRPLVVAVSARALFDIEAYHDVFEREGLDRYIEHVRANETAALEPGSAFPLVKALLKLNETGAGRVVDVVTGSSIHPDGGIMVLNALASHGLAVNRALFTGGQPVVPRLGAFGVDLLLTKSLDDARAAIACGIAAAVMYDSPNKLEIERGDQITIAFDGDAVIFSQESEEIYKSQGLEAFMENERRRAEEPMADGPFAKLLRTLQRIQSSNPHRKPFRIQLVTARGGNAKERVLRTLRAWGILIDEAYFMMGSPKDRILEALRPHIFFDDQDVHCRPAAEFVPSGLVPWATVEPRSTPGD